jgi:anti-sigma-K factor RskA
MGSSWTAGVEAMSDNIKSASLRYRHPEICEYLASQYVAGSMTPLVRSRMESLIAMTPELNRAVASWSDQFSKLHYQFPEEQPSDNLWKAIDNQISHEDIARASKPWWENLFVWQMSSVAGFVTSLAFAFFVFLSPGSFLEDGSVGGIAEVRSTPSYVAVMSDHGESDNGIRFVINAYKKTDSRPSQLFVQWSKRNPRENQQILYLWAEDKDTGQLTFIGVQPAKGEAWSLNKPSWQAVTNSKRLLMTSNQELPSNNNLVFSGPCIQLSDWGQQTI